MPETVREGTYKGKPTIGVLTGVGRDGEELGKDISTALEKYKQAGANLLMPSTQIAGLSEFHKPIIETVKLSSDPSDGDVYAHDDAKTRTPAHK